MLYVAVGALGFLMAIAFDHPRIERVRWAKLTIGVIAFSTLGYAVVAAALHPFRFSLPAAVTATGWVFASIFFFLFIYSVFIEIPFRQTYLSLRPGRRVVDTGTYAMSRHPGVLWAALALVALVMATGSKVLLVACPIWILMNATWAYIEDRFYFPETLPGYADYKKEVPMFIPSASSLKKAARSMRHSRTRLPTEDNADGRHA